MEGDQSVKSLVEENEETDWRFHHRSLTRNRIGYIPLLAQLTRPLRVASTIGNLNIHMRCAATVNGKMAVRIAASSSSSPVATSKRQRKRQKASGTKFPLSGISFVCILVLNNLLLLYRKQGCCENCCAAGAQG